MSVSPRLSLVVAACNNWGIGVNGHLPWRLKEDMAFFKKITTSTASPEKQNAVIMGRKTWESIPEKFRPLPNRINVIISSKMQKPPSTNTYVARSMDDALQHLSTPEVQEKLDQCFVIGGSSIYKLALESSHMHRVYFTRVLADFECDTFMPEFIDDTFHQVQHADVDTGLKTENGIDFQFELYEKKH